MFLILLKKDSVWKDINCSRFTIREVASFDGAPQWRKCDAIVFILCRHWYLVPPTLFDPTLTSCVVKREKSTDRISSISFKTFFYHGHHPSINSFMSSTFMPHSARSLQKVVYPFLRLVQRLRMHLIPMHFPSRFNISTDYAQFRNDRHQIRLRYDSRLEAKYRNLGHKLILTSISLRINPQLLHFAWLDLRHRFSRHYWVEELRRNSTDTGSRNHMLTDFLISSERFYSEHV